MISGVAREKKNHSNNNNNNILRRTHDMLSARARALVFRPLVYYSEGIKGWSKKRVTLPATVQQSWNNTHKQTARCTHGSLSYTVSACTGCTQLRRDQQGRVCECVHAAGGYMKRVVSFTKFLVSYMRSYVSVRSESQEDFKSCVISIIRHTNSIL